MSSYINLTESCFSPNFITFRYQSTFWMEPRVVPVKYTTEVNFSLQSPTKIFTETIDLQVIKRIFSQSNIN